MISILLLSIDRFDLLKKTLEHNLANCGTGYELLVCDNGSKDKRVIEYLESKKPTYFRKNSKNEGVGKAFNQLYLRANGTHLALMSNDITWPQDWGKVMSQWANEVPDSGLIGVRWCSGGVPPLTVKFGKYAHWLNAKENRVFGPTLFSQHVVARVGLFCEEFDVYALEDSDFNDRVNLSGLNSLYVPDLWSQHLDHDVGNKSDYRKMKDDSMARNWQIYSKRVEGRDKQALNLKEPLPPERDPI